MNKQENRQFLMESKKGKHRTREWNNYEKLRNDHAWQMKERHWSKSTKIQQG